MIPSEVSADGPLLSIESLSISFSSENGPVMAVNDLSLSLDQGRSIGIVGESGSGKSMTALSVMGLLPEAATTDSGRILFEGVNIPDLPKEQMRALRGSRIAMIFQEPMTSLNPVLTIGDQISEQIVLHQGLSRNEATEKCLELLRKVQIPAPAERLGSYPHQLSGGMRQRIMTAMAISCSPSLLIADEPTTALDVTIQAQILELLDAMRRKSALSLMLITHDLGIVSERTDTTCVMYAGSVMEQAPTGRIFSSPMHPYTVALLDSLPCNAQPGQPLKTIPGHPPRSAGSVTGGCPFAARCTQTMAVCQREMPPLTQQCGHHSVRCWKHV